MSKQKQSLSFGIQMTPISPCGLYVLVQLCLSQYTIIML